MVIRTIGDQSEETGMSEAAEHALKLKARRSLDAWKRQHN